MLAPRNMMVAAISIQTLASMTPVKATSWGIRAPRAETYPAWASHDGMRPVCFALAPTLTRISIWPTAYGIPIAGGT